MSKGAWKNHAYVAKKFIDGKWRYFYGNAAGAINKVGKGIRDFHTTKAGMALKYNPVSNAINKASSAAKAKKGRVLYANQKNAYMRNPNERNQQLARQGKSSNNAARLKASVLRETAQAKKGAAKILLDLKSKAKKAAKDFRYSANRPDYAVGRAFRKAGKGIKNLKYAKTYAKAAAGNIRVAGQRSKKALDNFHATKAGMALKYNPVSNAIAKASSKAKAKKGMKIYNKQTMHDSQRIAQANAASAKKAHNSVGSYAAQAKKTARKIKSGVDSYTSNAKAKSLASKNAKLANKNGKSMTNYYSQYSDAATNKAAAVKSQRDNNHAAYVEKMMSYGYSRKEAEKRWKNKKNK